MVDNTKWISIPDQETVRGFQLHFNPFWNKYVLYWVNDEFMEFDLFTGSEEDCFEVMAQVVEKLKSKTVRKFDKNGIEIK